MKVCGVLSWYDESPAWLAAACSGFARVCDQIVAVDGSYALLPGARPASHPLQAEAVLSACEAGGAACTIHRPNDLFYGNEVEKRNFTLRLAGAHLEEGDWVIIFDADVHIFKLNEKRVRAELERTERMIASYTVLDGIDYLSDPDMAEYVAKEEYATEWTIRTNDIYRWHPSLLYGPQHWMVSRDIGGERRWLRHSDQFVPPVLDLGASLVAYHRTANRSKVRADMQAAYYQARDLHGIEFAVPGEPSDNGLPELQEVI